MADQFKEANSQSLAHSIIGGLRAAAGMKNRRNAALIDVIGNPSGC
jgi:hypothetical protein